MKGKQHTVTAVEGTGESRTAPSAAPRAACCSKRRDDGAAQVAVIPEGEQLCSPAKQRVARA